MSKKLAGANSVKVGSYIIFDNAAYTVKDVQISRTGKHGHAKIRIEAVGMVDGRKIIKIMPSHDNVEVPIIEKKTAQVLSVHGDVANVMDMTSYETMDLKIPDEFKGEIKEGRQVVYWIILDDKIIKQVRSSG